MARTKAELSAGARLADFLTVGFLAMQCPVDAVRNALQKNGAQSKRRRGLPHEMLVYFVMMMVLYGNVAYEDVMRLVVEGLRTLLGDTALERSVVTKGPSRRRGRRWARLHCASCTKSRCVLMALKTCLASCFMAVGSWQLTAPR